MIVSIALYALVGIISCFTALIILKVNDVTDEGSLIMYPLVSFILWPVSVPITLAIFMVLGMGNLAEKVANRIKDNRRKK